jgi:putative membrane protein
VALAISAFWELLEWWGAYALRGGDPAFLGGQGDPWDTQWDMFLALVGAVVALAALSRWHDRQLGRLVTTGGPVSAPPRGGIPARNTDTARD